LFASSHAILPSGPTLTEVTPMLEKIAAYLERRMEANAVNPDPFERRQVAVAALLVEASRLDGHYDAAEQGTVVRLLRETLKLPAEQARLLLAVAEPRQANTWNDWIFCESVRRGFTPAERVDVVRDLWEVALADGKLHRMETMMIDAVAKKLDIPPADAAKAKAEAEQRAKN
jgi:uncharacterized tellurite resistance protein B-like protein